MKVNIVKLVTDAVIPQYAKPGDAGMDLIAVGIEETDDYIQYKTGIKMEIPEGYVGFIFPRSSNSKKDLLLCNSVGVIDSGYRGEILIRYNRVPNPMTLEVINNITFNRKNSTFDINVPIKKYEIGDAVAQIIIMPYPQIEFNEVEELSETERGEGGFGSTDINQVVETVQGNETEGDMIISEGTTE